MEQKNTHLNTLYNERIIAWRDLAGRWDRQECEYREMAEARAAMDVVGALLVGMEKRHSGRVDRCPETRIVVVTRRLPPLLASKSSSDIPDPR